MTPLYVHLLGERFAKLSPSVRALHDVRAPATWTGESEVERGRNILSRLAGWITGLPPAGRNIPLEVTFTPVDGEEIWSRKFGSATFRTIQFEQAGALHERAGPVTFGFNATIDNGSLVLQLTSLRVLGLPLPRIFHPAIATREEETPDGLYRFAVSSRLPLVGLLVAYRGWLKPRA